MLQLVEKIGLRLPVPDLATGEPHCLIKSVSSICRVPLFAAAAPEMRFVHIVRHPGAVIASLLRGIEQGLMKRAVFVDDVAALSNARELGISAEQLKRLSYEEQVACTWLIQNDKSHREVGAGANYRLVSYEQLCVDTAMMIRELCEFVGIAFDAQMASFISSMDGAGDDGGYFSVAKNPRGSISRWESQLGPETAAKVSHLMTHAPVGRFVLQRYRDACARASAAS